jgi:hypothetical protein
MPNGFSVSLASFLFPFLCCFFLFAERPKESIGGVRALTSVLSIALPLVALRHTVPVPVLTVRSSSVFWVTFDKL